MNHAYLFLPTAYLITNTGDSALAPNSVISGEEYTSACMNIVARTLAGETNDGTPLSFPTVTMVSLDTAL